MLQQRDVQLTYQNMEIAKEMYPPEFLNGSLEMLNIPLSSPDLFEKASRCNDDTIYGVQGSFRKLEID